MKTSSFTTRIMPVACAVLSWAMAATSALAGPASVGDAYVRIGADGRTWTIGNSALELEFQFADGVFRLAGFGNKLRAGAAGYVDPATAQAPFMAGNAGGFQTEVIWTKTLRGEQNADPADDRLQLTVRKGDLIGFGVYAGGDVAIGDSTQWITKVAYDDGESHVSTDDITLKQGPVWYYCIHTQGTRFLEYLDTVESVTDGIQYNDAWQPIAGTGTKQTDPAAERIRCTSTYTPYRLPRFSPFANAMRLQPSWIIGAMRVWRAPKDGLVAISGRARTAGGKADIEIVRFREPSADSGKNAATAGAWRLESSEARSVNFGGRPAVQLDVNLTKQALRARYHALVYPGASVFRHWVELENTGTVPVGIGTADHFSLCMPVPAGPLTHYWMFGSDSRPNAGLLQSAEVSDSYHRATLGYMNDFYTPWLAMFRQRAGEGWFMASEYNARWIFGVDRDASGRVTVSASLPELAGRELAPGSRFQLPTITLGVFRDSLEDMQQRLYDWQYEYLWDFTSDEWYGRMLLAPGWYNNVHNLQENFAGRLADLDLSGADMMRTIGAEILWDDAAWSESISLRTPTQNGPDFAETNRYLARSGDKWLVWFRGWPWPSAGIMDTKVGSWGDFQWRTDALDLPNLAAQESWFRQVTTFLDRHPRSSFHSCSGGSRFAHTFDAQRYTDINMLTDGGAGDQTNYYFSYLDTPDKWMDVIPSIQSDGDYVPETSRQILTMVPCWDVGWRPEGKDIEQARRIGEIYRYLTQEGVAGRWTYLFHPGIKGDAEYYYSQRTSHDRKRACIILKHQAPGAVTIYPRGLLPGHSYVVGYDSIQAVSTRTGADLMANGITIARQAPGELIYLGLPGRPGAGTDHTPPEAPGAVLSRRETNLGHTGVGVYWSPGTDDNFVSYHEVRRGDVVLGKTSSGTYFFDHAQGWDPQARYQVRTVDGDGNASAWIQAQPAADEPLTYYALGGHFTEAGREGWSAETSVDGRSFEPMTFVPPAKNPFGNLGGTGKQPGGIEGYWEQAGAARCGRGWQQTLREWQQTTRDAQCIRKWVAPRAGTVRILGRAVKEYYRLHQGATLRVRIMHNERQLWPESGWSEVTVGDGFGCPHDVTTKVAAGDAIRFVLDPFQGTDPDNDIIAWMPRIVYTDPENAGRDRSGESVVRLLCGSDRDYVDSLGNTWMADRYHAGGKAVKPGTVDAGRMSTQDNLALYELGREGEEFTYTIPVEPGLYTVRLLFAEPQYDWFFERPFNLSINGRQVLRNFDVCQAARGPRRAYARVFRSLVPDGNNHLVLRFSGGFDPLQKSHAAIIQAIEVLPALKPAVRIDVGAGHGHIDWNSRAWSPDVAYQGGDMISSESPVDQASPTLYDQRLYQTARSGREFAYRIAVPPGLYSVHLKFAELWLAQPGQRPMDIEINGRVFWAKWDPASAAGRKGMAMDLRAQDITPDKDGVITIRITATGPNDAILQGLEVE